MNDEPNLSFDIDALFDHMVNELDLDLDEELEWVFMLRSPEHAKLERIAPQWADEFEVMLRNSNEIAEDAAIFADLDEDYKDDGDEEEESYDGSALFLTKFAALSPAEVKAIAARLTEVATTEGVEYAGVECYESLDDFFDWMDLDEAKWRLTELTGAGLDENVEMPWAFLFLAEEVSTLSTIHGVLLDAGYVEISIYDEPDEDGLVGICVFVVGRNNAEDLAETYKTMEEIAETHDVDLAGVQFFSQDQLSGADEEELP